MNATSLVRLSVIALVLATAAVGCKKRPDRITKIPGLSVGSIADSRTGPLDVGPGVNDPNAAIAENTSIPLTGDLTGWVPAAEQPFRGDTVYFDFDKAVIKASEIAKIEKVVAGMKNYPGKALRIEGHCDERGTEEYNRALGEKRALAVREKLVTTGIESRRADTISYGEDRPAEVGHEAAAWSRNRRAEFILLEPPTSASLQ
jgi:peptidoglycan-associated lipoprotein